LKYLLGTASNPTMVENTSKKLVVLDGRTGEGGGQLVRIAACLSAITGTPIHIHDVRGNRGKGKNKASGGGETSSQHNRGFSAALS